MQSPDTDDEAPLVPQMTDASEATDVASEATDDASRRTACADGGNSRPTGRPFDRPPATDHATEYTRDEEEIEPFVADLR